jgi:hypothetical protein
MARSVNDYSNLTVNVAAMSKAKRDRAKSKKCGAVFTSH